MCFTFVHRLPFIIMLLLNLLLIEILKIRFLLSVKFIYKIENSNSPIKLKYSDKLCYKQFCFGNINVKIEKKWFKVSFNERNKTRNAIQSICKHLEKDYFYNLAFQCINPSKSIKRVLKFFFLSASLM